MKLFSFLNASQVNSFISLKWIFKWVKFRTNGRPAVSVLKEIQQKFLAFTFLASIYGSSFFVFFCVCLHLLNNGVPYNTLIRYVLCRKRDVCNITYGDMLPTNQMNVKLFPKMIHRKIGNLIRIKCSEKHQIVWMMWWINNGWIVHHFLCKLRWGGRGKSSENFVGIESSRFKFWVRIMFMKLNSKTALSVLFFVLPTFT